MSKTLEEKFKDPEIQFCGYEGFHREHRWDNSNEHITASNQLEFYICKGWAVAPPSRK